MGTTNYYNTFIAVASDSPASAAIEPPSRDEPTVAELHYELIAAEPYTRTSDEVIFETYARRAGINDTERDAAREAFFSKGQPCLRSSPLGKRYGWGIHHDSEGRVALVPLGSDEYERFASDPSVAHTSAMRSTRGTP